MLVQFDCEHLSRTLFNIVNTLAKVLRHYDVIERLLKILCHRDFKSDRNVDNLEAVQSSLQSLFQQILFLSTQSDISDLLHSKYYIACFSTCMKWLSRWCLRAYIEMV